MKPFKIFIFAGERDTFLQRQSSLESFGVAKEMILWADSSRYSRQHYINGNSNEWLLFLDHDCFPEVETFAAVEQIISLADQQSSIVFAGCYKNPEPSALLQRAHNFISNGWLEQSFLHGQVVLLGGVFLIYCTREIQDSSEVFWGGEDKLLSHQLRELGVPVVYEPNLTVIHNTSCNIFHFLRRAWLHGTNEVRYIPRAKRQVNYLYWLRKAELSDLSLAPLIALHFCIQRAALLFQKVRPANK